MLVISIGRLQVDQFWLSGWIDQGHKDWIVVFGDLPCRAVDGDYRSIVGLDFIHLPVGIQSFKHPFAFQRFQLLDGFLGQRIGSQRKQ